MAGIVTTSPLILQRLTGQHSTLLVDICTSVFRVIAVPLTYLLVVMAAQLFMLLSPAALKGLLRSIGVSNFGIPHLEKLSQTSNIPPAVNQIELHPWLQRRELVEHCKKLGIVLEVTVVE